MFHVSAPSVWVTGRRGSGRPDPGSHTARLGPGYSLLSNFREPGQAVRREVTERIRGGGAESHSPDRGNPGGALRVKSTGPLGRKRLRPIGVQARSDGLLPRAHLPQRPNWAHVKATEQLSRCHQFSARGLGGPNHQDHRGPRRGSTAPREMGGQPIVPGPGEPWWGNQERGYWAPGRNRLRPSGVQVRFNGGEEYRP